MAGLTATAVCEASGSEPVVAGGQDVGRQPLTAGKKDAVDREPLADDKKTKATPSSLTVNGQPPATNPQPPATEVDSPVARQRALIADYMTRHTQFAIQHPLAQRLVMLGGERAAAAFGDNR